MYLRRCVPMLAAVATLAGGAAPAHAFTAAAPAGPSLTRSAGTLPDRAASGSDDWFIAAGAGCVVVIALGGGIAVGNRRRVETRTRVEHTRS